MQSAGAPDPRETLFRTHGNDSLLAGPRRDEWIRLEGQKRNDLLEAECNAALHISTLDELKGSLHEMPDRFRIRELPLFVQRLNPALEHLRSFTNAITSASQYTPVACLVWGGIQAIVESACVVSLMSEEVVDMIVELNTTLPQFDSYLALFPGKHELQWALQDIFDEFLTYCITAAQYFRRGYARSYFANFFSSGPQNSLRKSKVKILRHIKTFQQAAELIHREEVRRQNIEVTKRLASNLTELPKEFASAAEMTKVDFPVTTVTMYRNYTFTGRGDILDPVHKILQGSQTDKEDLASDGQLEAENFVKRSKGPACCVLHGMGGIGKTQIALEYTYRNRGNYDAVFWLESEHDWTLASTYAAIADKLNLLGSKTTDEDGDQRQTLAIQKAREWLETTERSWLIVFDNVEDINDLNAYLPIQTKGHGGILITTQKPITFSMTEVFGAISIKPFNRDDAATLLFKYLQKEPENERDEDVARELSDIVDGLPLAIATIGGYVNQSGSSLEEYIDTLKHSANAWTASAVGPVRQYEKNLETVFDIALRELSASAAGVAGVLAFLNPDHIPELLFTTAIQKKTLDFLRSKADLLEAVRELRTRQLIRRDTSGTEPFLSIHRTVQWNILLHLSKDENHRWSVFQQAFRIVRDVLPQDSPFIVPSPDKWPKFQKFGPHILSLRTHCLWPDPPIELPVNFARVLSDMGTFMWHAGKFPEGEEALETAVDIMDEQGVTDNNLRANVYEMLGIMSSFEGVSERKKSMDLRYKAREARRLEYESIPQKKLSKDDDIKALIVESDLAYGFVQQEDFLEASMIMQQCLKKYKEWGSEEELPYQYSQYYQIQGVCLMAAGEPVESIGAISRCAELLVIASDVMHPMTQLMRFIVGFLTWNAGEETKALEINETVLEARRKIVGEFSHFTLESYSTCGRMLAHKGDYAKARIYLDRCLERRKRAAWNEEGVARAQFRYADVLDHLGEADEAEKLRSQAKKTRDKYLDLYPEYLPKDGDAEAIHDQMVSIWAGRFTGKLKQKSPIFPDVPDMVDLHVDDDA